MFYFMTKSQEVGNYETMLSLNQCCQINEILLLTLKLKFVSCRIEKLLLKFLFKEMLISEQIITTV